MFKEKIISSGIEPIGREQLLIMAEKMEKCLCLIYTDNGSRCSGFFCKIPLKNNNEFIPVLITVNRLISEHYLKKNNNIHISLNNGNVTKNINLNNRKVYTNKQYDIAIIEIKPQQDNINDFLELDQKIFDNHFPEMSMESSIYLLHYPRADSSKVSLGIIKGINEGKIEHTCLSESGSGGGPILFLGNSKVIGVHCGTVEMKNVKVGNLLNNSIIEFQRLF